MSPDGRRIVSCGNVLYEPEVVKVWDVATGKCVAMLEGHGNNVRCGVRILYYFCDDVSVS